MNVNEVIEAIEESFPEVKREAEESKRLSDIRNGVIEFKDIENPTNDECIATLSCSGLNLKYIKNPTPEMIETALDDDPSSIQYVEDQKKYEYMAVSRNPKWYIDRK